MTNLEFYKDEIYEIQRDLFDKGLCISDSIGVAICNVYTKHTGLNSFMPMVLDWLLAEYKVPIKLKQWEMELIGYIYRTGYVKETFGDYKELNYMKNRGHFKGITDTDMKLSEILDNCEVEEDE